MVQVLLEGIHQVRDVGVDMWVCVFRIDEFLDDDVVRVDDLEGRGEWIHDYVVCGGILEKGRVHVRRLSVQRVGKRVVL